MERVRQGSLCTVAGTKREVIDEEEKENEKPSNRKEKKEKKKIAEGCETRHPNQTQTQKKNKGVRSRKHKEWSANSRRRSDNPEKKRGRE